MKNTKIILFGGSFDPVHNGHLQVAKEVFEQLSADRLVFVPARRSPHKNQMPTKGHHRCEMIRLAIAEEACFSISDCELIRPAPSYTLDTISFFKKQFGSGVVLYWLIGADQLTDFDKWYKVTELVDVCCVTVMYRAGYPKPSFENLQTCLNTSQISKLERNVIETSLIPISSTQIRQQLADGFLPTQQLPNRVLQYIRAHKLYGFNG